MTECHRCLIHQEEIAVNVQNLALSKVSGGINCNSNVNSGTETYAANLIFMR